LIENFPFDKYEVENCEITQALLAKGQKVCWQTFIQNSFKKEGRGFPFGYLKANSTGTAINLYVCPYNYPQLYPLLSKAEGKRKEKRKRKAHLLLFVCFRRAVKKPEGSEQLEVAKQS